MFGTPYPPTIYVIFALWLLPLKLLGLITSAASLPHYLTYWLKILTTLAYSSTVFLFYRICLVFKNDTEWAKFAATSWATMPLAVFSQFIFSQYDVFYVLLTLSGILMFLRGRLYLASIYFGLAITFKYFPAFVFLPMLCLYEKRLSRLALCTLIVSMPTLAVYLLYGNSPAFIEGVYHHAAIDRIYAASIDIGLSGFWNSYWVPTSFAFLCGVAYLAEPSKEALPRIAAYIWLVCAVLPFLFILWHPQWLEFIAAPIALTTMLQAGCRKWMVLDLAGMLCFVAVVSLTFIDNVDAAMFQGANLGFQIGNSYPMANLFSWFGAHSVNVFYSGFSAYLVLQIALKRQALAHGTPENEVDRVDYSLIRARLYLGLLIFLLPASYSLYRDLGGNVREITNMVLERSFGPLYGTRTFEQTIIARGREIKRVGILLETASGIDTTELSMDILDENGKRIAGQRKVLESARGIAWHTFQFGVVPTIENRPYKIRLTAPPANAMGMGITWWGSIADSYKDGVAIVDGVRQDADFAFRVTFLR